MSSKYLPGINDQRLCPMTGSRQTEKFTQPNWYSPRNIGPPLALICGETSHRVPFWARRWKQSIPFCPSLFLFIFFYHIFFRVLDKRDEPLTPHHCFYLHTPRWQIRTSNAKLGEKCLKLTVVINLRALWGRSRSLNVPCF